MVYSGSPNYVEALNLARAESLDAVIHGGDLFHRSRVPQNVVIRSFESLVSLADDGIPVFIVPGNHERSVIPESLFALHELITIFHRPMSSIAKIGDLTIEIAGFPSIRNKIKNHFPTMLAELERQSSDPATPEARLLLMHQTVEGAQVGVSDFTFRGGNDVVAGDQIPNNFDLILSGHIHRYQHLVTSLRGVELGTPVLYPGSIERTSFDERHETKGVVIVTISNTGSGRIEIEHKFAPLRTRPMVAMNLSEAELEKGLESAVRRVVATIDANSVVRLRVPSESDLAAVSADAVRALTPPEMNLTISVRSTRRRRRVE